MYETFIKPLYSFFSSLGSYKRPNLYSRPIELKIE